MKVSEQVVMLEERVEELNDRLRVAEERLYAAQRGVDIANQQADRAHAERDNARAELLKQFARRPEMTATEVLLRQGLALARWRTQCDFAKEAAEIWRKTSLRQAEKACNPPAFMTTRVYRFAPKAGTYFWLGSYADA